MAMRSVVAGAVGFRIQCVLGMASELGPAVLSVGAADLETLLLRDRSEMEELLSQDDRGCCFWIGLRPTPCCLSVRSTIRVSCPAGGPSTGGAVGWSLAGCPATADEAHAWMEGNASKTILATVPRAKMHLLEAPAQSNASSPCEPQCKEGRGVCAKHHEGALQAVCYCRTPFSGATCAEGGVGPDTIRDGVLSVLVRNFPESAQAFQSEVPLLYACVLWMLCVCLTLAMTFSVKGESEGRALFKMPAVEGNRILHADSPFFLEDDCEEAWVRAIPDEDPHHKAHVDLDRSWGRSVNAPWRGNW